ncbi:DUF4352 domain-containing protein [Nocardioides albus]|uniref:DUF4352 domain-containing protein n=1 Tax=Nocardioides albus TaxID=1841 RepID=A0A7W5F7J6_9ACTN|nr:DUF4352 domain-containing protein [Nocardioides albus]MBB3088240.1 hypothetical protein [Nocardioides albus]GGU42844.1 hypothetical protein GCM10007979_47660 [Nocardioides albus]
MSNEPTANVRQQMSQAVAKEVADGGWRVESQTDYHTVLAKGGRTNHVLHLILTIFTCGLWSLAWLLIAHLNRRQSLVLRVDEYGNFSRQKTDSKGALIGACVVAGVLLIGGIVGAASGGGGADDSAGTATDATTDAASSGAAGDKPKADKPEQGSAKRPFKVGQTAKLEGTAYTVAGASTQSNVGGEFGEQADGVFVVVDLTVENTKNETKTFMDTAAVFIAKDGTKYEGSDAALYLGEESLFLRDMQPDLATKGKLVFDVPPAKAAGGILQVSDLFGRGETHFALGLK